MARTRNFADVIKARIAVDPVLAEAIENESINASIARQVYNARKETGLTQKQLAERVGEAFFHRKLVGRCPRLPPAASHDPVIRLHFRRPGQIEFPRDEAPRPIIGVVVRRHATPADLYQAPAHHPTVGIEAAVDREIAFPAWEGVARVVPDEIPVLTQTLEELSDKEGCCLIITTGGTGPAKRDITPEVTEAVCQKLMPGCGELMRKVSLEKVPTAILSRQAAGVRERTLIVNLPGQPKAIRECLDAVFPAIPYCIDLLEGPYLETDESRIIAFRPKKK